MRDRLGRRGLWLILAMVGVVGIAGWWLAPYLTGAVAGYAEADLDQRDKLSSVGSLFIGLASLIAAVVALFVQTRQTRSQATSVSGMPPAPTMPQAAGPGRVSLAPPMGLPETQVRGRDALAAELSRLYRRSARRTPQVRILSGMGGAGKTTIALAAAHRLRAEGVQVWWISAATDTELQTGMRCLAGRLGATNTEVDRAWGGLDSAPDLLWRQLANYQHRWLLIIDNADDVRFLAPPGEPIADGRGWIRPVPTTHGRVIVTTRDGNLDTWRPALTTGQHPPTAWCRLHPVDMLAFDDGAQILCDLTGPWAGGHEQAVALAVRLGGHALALSLAGHYLSDSHRLPLPAAITTYTAYQAVLDAGHLPETAARSIVDLADPFTSVQVRRVIGQTWELSLDLLANRGQSQARPLLRLLSLLADTPIPYQILLDAQVMTTSPLFTGLDTAGLRGLLHALAGVGLISFRNPESTDQISDASPAMLEVHPLVRATSRHHLHDSSERDTYLELAARLVEHAGGDGLDDSKTFPTWRSLTPHALQLWTTAESAGQRVVEATVQPARHAVHYLAVVSCLYAAARTEATNVYRVCNQVLGPEHPQTLAARADLALWSTWTGDAVADSAAARDQLETLLPLLEQTCGPEHRETLKARNSLALATAETGDERTARSQLAAILPAWQRQWGHEHPATLRMQVRLTYFNGTAEHPAAVREQLTALLSDFERIHGTDHVDVLWTRRIVACWTGWAGEPAPARDQLAALLPVYEREWGTDNPNTLGARVDFAVYTGEAGSPAEARDQLTALVPVFERTFGQSNRRTLSCRAELAFWCGEAGDPTAARDQFATLSPLFDQAMGAEHPDTLSVRVDLAEWTGQTGDAATARDQLATLVSLQEQVRGSNSPITLYVRARLIHWTGVSTGDAEKARAQITKLISSYGQAWGTEHPRMLRLQAELARWEGRAGNAEAARDQLTALLPVQTRVCGAEHPDTLETAICHAEWTGRAGDASTAKDRLAALLSACERILKPDHPKTLKARAELAQWTARTGDEATARNQFELLLPNAERVLGRQHPDFLDMQDRCAEWARS